MFRGVCYVSLRIVGSKGLFTPRYIPYPELGRVFGNAGNGALVCACVSFRERSTGTVEMDAEAAEFSVLTWNVLAHIHTHWDAARHQNEPEKPKPLESTEQRRARHAQVVQTLRRLSPDIALLQEVDVTFMPKSWQPAAGALLPCGETLEGYTPYRSYSERDEGAVVLLKDTTFERDRSMPVAYLPASSAHGWKTGVALRARGRLFQHVSIAVASVHLRWGSPEHQHALLSSALRTHGTSTVPFLVGGDFNVATQELGATIHPLLEGAGLQRVATPSGVATGMHSQACIDHIYASPQLRAESASVGPLAPQDRGPWGPPEGHDGSDHAWLLARFSVPPPQRAT